MNKRQVKLCRQNLEHMASVKMGAFMSVLECQFQFRQRRWNCSVVNHNSMFGNVLQLGTRETAFVHAISAAGVAHTVTKDCSSGKLEKCGCDRSISGFSQQGFQWAGCSDNIHYGTAFSRQFVDAHERRKKRHLDRILMNLHNNEAGRKSIEKNMRIQCKCHGVSGSCELKTCWQAMPPFREIGYILKEKFDGATEPHTVEDLVYLHESPDYCVSNNATGTVGTQGRVCNRTSKGIDGCELLCCGRGYTTRIEKRIERCQCKFHWCCYVKCKQCVQTVEVNICA